MFSCRNNKKNISSFWSKKVPYLELCSNNIHYLGEIRETSVVSVTEKQALNANKHQKDCIWKQETNYGLENGSLGFIETLHKQ